jgi:hypothetical protein
MVRASVRFGCMYSHDISGSAALVGVLGFTNRVVSPIGLIRLSSFARMQ